MEDTFPDLGSLSDKELKDLIDKLTEEENEISYKRRVLHGKIDILRAELVNRLRQKRERGDSLILRRRRPAADRDPRGQGPDLRRGRAGRLSVRRRRWQSTAQSAGSPTPRGPTTARSAAPTSALGPQREARNRRR